MANIKISKRNDLDLFPEARVVFDEEISNAKQLMVFTLAETSSKPENIRQALTVCAQLLSGRVQKPIEKLQNFKDFYSKRGWNNIVQ